VKVLGALQSAHQLFSGSSSKSWMASLDMDFLTGEESPEFWEEVWEEDEEDLSELVVEIDGTLDTIFCRRLCDVVFKKWD
jgi:hypothetical protein